MTIAPIETQYQGYRFRSRLEARWAVCFDAMAIKWEYEYEGFQTPYGGYLPDFLLPEINVWIEVKPEGADENHPDSNRWSYVAKATGKSIIILSGVPDKMANYTIIYPCGNAMTVDKFVSDHGELCAKSARFEMGSLPPRPIQHRDVIELKGIASSVFFRSMSEFIDRAALDSRKRSPSTPSVLANLVEAMAPRQKDTG